MRLIVLSAFLAASCVHAPPHPTAPVTAAPAAPTIITTRVGLADCLTRNGATLYVASWCHACRFLEGMFGPEAYARLHVVVCDKDGKTACIDLHISTIPTWITSDGTRFEGVDQVQPMAAHAGCPIAP